MKRTLSFLILSIIVLSPFTMNAQAVETTDQKEARLRLELAAVEKEQAETEKVLLDAQNQSASISRDILILDTKIKAAQLNIKAKNLLIQTLGKNINDKQNKIVDLQGHISKGQETLGQILRKNNEIDSTSFAEFLLSKQDLSQAFVDIDNFQSVQESLKITFETLRNNKTQTEVEKSNLSTKKSQEQNALAVIESEKKSIESNQKEKQKLLNISKDNELTYSQELAAKKAQASQIRAALFSLRDTAAISFGDALKYANIVSQKTGVRPAFLLAIIMQESNLGANVGSCYVTNLINGDGVGKNSGLPFEQVMKAPRDTVSFVSITKALGKNWAQTPVSCPIGSAKYYKGRGFGGGMGPSQFIPSTWDLFSPRISTSLGIDNPNPWNAEHAFLASGFYLTDLGAISGSYAGEIRAACKYYGSGGSNCTYGNQVMAKAANIQKNMIDPLQGL